MSDDESFLARWSRRKRAAPRQPPERPTVESGASVAQPEASASDPPAEAQPPFDLATLPPIESIAAGSDIRAFLAPGVPAEVTRAALRRAWSVDPVTRDFIGLSESAWDFTAPGGVPGFGAVTAEDVRELLARILEEPDAAPRAHAAAPPPVDQAAAQTDETAPTATSTLRQPRAQTPGENRPSADEDTSIEHGGAVPRLDDNGAMQHKSTAYEYYPRPPRRSRGGALPE